MVDKTPQGLGHVTRRKIWRVSSSALLYGCTYIAGACHWMWARQPPLSSRSTTRPHLPQQVISCSFYILYLTCAQRQIGKQIVAIIALCGLILHSCIRTNSQPIDLPEELGGKLTLIFVNSTRLSGIFLVARIALVYISDFPIGKGLLDNIRERWSIYPVYLFLKHPFNGRLFNC